MTQQLDLFSSMDNAPKIEEQNLTIEERFQLFHDQNPHVANILAQRAFSLKRQGVRHWGIAALFEVLRYEFALKTQGDAFKLNNDFRALYSRMLMDEYPELEGFFETRARRHEQERS